jgi:hypothetical protein
MSYGTFDMGILVRVVATIVGIGERPSTIRRFDSFNPQMREAAWKADTQ